ncbi:hypothetical protein Bbelb_338930 [Branchiostoma belcheri]|nr:hypothetical protein Bbelb_338930 [Branchiostoma belcheri]
MYYVGYRQRVFAAAIALPCQLGTAVCTVPTVHRPLLGEGTLSRAVPVKSAYTSKQPLVEGRGVVQAAPVSSLLLSARDGRLLGANSPVQRPLKLGTAVQVLAAAVKSVTVQVSAAPINGRSEANQRQADLEEPMTMQRRYIRPRRSMNDQRQAEALRPLVGHAELSSSNTRQQPPGREGKWYLAADRSADSRRVINAADSQCSLLAQGQIYSSAPRRGLHLDPVQPFSSRNDDTEESLAYRKRQKGFQQFTLYGRLYFKTKTWDAKLPKLDASLSSSHHGQKAFKATRGQNAFKAIAFISFCGKGHCVPSGTDHLPGDRAPDVNVVGLHVMQINLTSIIAALHATHQLLEMSPSQTSELPARKTVPAALRYADSRCVNVNVARLAKHLATLVLCLNGLGSDTVLGSLRVSKSEDLPQARFWIRVDYPQLSLSTVLDKTATHNETPPYAGQQEESLYPEIGGMKLHFTIHDVWEDYPEPCCTVTILDIVQVYPAPYLGQTYDVLGYVETIHNRA